MSIHVLRISLHGSKPPIWRRVAVPSAITLGGLHEVIQIAMGWTDSHLHQFILRDKSLKPTRDEIRRMNEADCYTDVFINRMRGMRVFVMTSTPFGNPFDLDMEGEDEGGVTLAEVCPAVKSKLIYEYDFGDGWDHRIEVQKIEPAKDGVTYPVCLAGKKACPPEDCGGVYGYYYLLDVLATPDHEEHADMLEWMGGPFDPDAFDIDDVNAILADWR